jgi:excisionase family DNA binding protein
MSSEGLDFNDLGVTAPEMPSPRKLDHNVAIDRDILDEIRQVVRETIREELAAQRPMPKAEQENSSDIPAPKSTIKGLELPPGEPLKARDLRIALLLGKTPENAGLLIDADTTAQLMSISQRTLYRLVDEKAIPQPVRLSGRLIRWRLGDLLEWIEAGCPHTKHWTYNPTQRQQGKQRK